MWRCRAFLLGMLVLTASFSADADSKKVTLGTSVWPPYIMSEKSSNRGYAYDVVTKAFELMGYKVSILVMPWDEARKLTMEGKIDGLFPEYDSKQNLAYFTYSDAFLAGPLVLYEKKGKPSLSVPETNNQVDFFNQMKAYRFGVVSGYANVPAFDQNASLKKKEVLDDKANLEQLYRGDVDFILIDGLNAQYILDHKLPPDYHKTLQRVGPVLGNMPFYIVFSKKISNINTLNNDFNQGLEKMKNKKITYQIMQKYIYDFIDNQAAPKKLNIINNNK